MIVFRRAGGERGGGHPEEKGELAMDKIKKRRGDRFDAKLVRNIGKAVFPAAGGPGSGMFFLAGLGAAAAGAAKAAVNVANLDIVNVWLGAGGT